MVLAMIVVMIMPVGMRLMRMLVRGTGVGAAFGIERRLDLDDARAKALYHRLDNVIAAYAQGLWHDLGRQMAVAEVPGDPDQMMRIAPLDLDQRLGRRHHVDQPPVLEHQRIPSAQRDGVLKIEQKLNSARARHRHPPPMPIVEIKDDGIGRRFLPAMLAQDFGRADHGVSH